MHKTVIIPCHNDDIDTLPAAIASAFPAGADEVIIVFDGNSPYPLPRAIGQFAMQNVTIVQAEGIFPAGVCHRRNMAIGRAKSGLIVPLDADDTLLPDSVHYMAAHWQPMTWVYGGWHELNERGFLTEHIAPPLSLFPKKSVCYATCLFHKDDWLRVGGYSVDFSLALEDMAFCCALTHHGVRPLRIDAILYERRVYSDGTSRTETAMKYWTCLTRLMKEKWPEAFR